MQEGTPLILAAENGHTECVQALLDARAIVEKIEKNVSVWTRVC